MLHLVQKHLALSFVKVFQNIYFLLQVREVRNISNKYCYWLYYNLFRFAFGRDFET